jgi:hypothetical protein
VNCLGIGNSADCTWVGSSGTNYGIVSNFVTLENALTAKIETETGLVPEPASLAALGVGLLGPVAGAPPQAVNHPDHRCRPAWQSMPAGCVATSSRYGRAAKCRDVNAPARRAPMVVWLQHRHHNAPCGSGGGTGHADALASTARHIAARPV